MGKGKPLFEVLHQQKAEQGGTLNLNAPRSKAQRKQEQQEAAAPPVGPKADSLSSRAPASAASPVQERKRPEPAAAERGGSSEGSANNKVVELVRRLRRPMVWQVPVWQVSTAALLMVTVVSGSFVIGHRLGVQSASAGDGQYVTDASPLDERQQEAGNGLSVAGTGGSEADADGSNLNGLDAPIALGDGRPRLDDPRIEGLNYFRLIEVPGSAGEEIHRIVDFLDDHGVDASVVRLNNGRLKVVALPGFERPRSDPRALALQERLKVLGRKWRSEHRGSTDWSDLMAEKYRPGVN